MVLFHRRCRKDKQAASGAVARGKAEVNAQVAASELAVVNAQAGANVRVVADARAAANVLVVVDVRVAASVLAAVNVRVAASVLAVVSVKVAVREHRRSNRSLPIQRRSNSKSSRDGEFEGRCLKLIRIQSTPLEFSNFSHRSVLEFCFSSPAGSDLRYSTRSSCSLGVNCKLNWML